MFGGFCVEIIIVLIALLIGGGLNLIKRFFPDFKVELLIKILAVTYFVVGFIRLFLPDDFILIIND